MLNNIIKINNNHKIFKVLNSNNINMDQFSLSLKNTYVLRSICLKKIFEKFFGLQYPVELIKITMITLFELINHNSTFVIFFKQKSGRAQKTIDLINQIKNRNDIVGII